MCGGPLAAGGPALRCAGCRLHYPSVDEVHLLRPPFSSDPPVHPAVDARLHALLADAERLGWDDALARFRDDVLGERLPAIAPSRWERALARLTGARWEDLLQDVTDPARAGWKFLLDLRPQTRALYLGPAWGAAALSLARTCAHVVVLDGSAARLRLVGHQARRAGLDNLTFACVRDPARLPLSPASVDVAVVHGVTRWWRATSTRGSDAGVMPRLVAELRRVLVPAGQAYLATSNRGWALLDPASRDAAASPSDFRTAGADAGFPVCRLLGVLPFPHRMHQIVDLDRVEPSTLSLDSYRARGHVLRTVVRAFDVSRRAGLVGRRLYDRLPGMSAILSSWPARASFAERLLEHVGSAGHAPRGIRLARYQVRGSGVVVLMGGRRLPEVVVRVPLDPHAAGLCEHHHRALLRMAADPRLPAAVRSLFPTAAGSGTFEGQPFFVEAALAGRSGCLYYAGARRHYDRAVTAAVELVRALRAATETPVRIDDAEFERLCGAWVAELARLEPDEALRHDLVATAARLRRTLVGTTLPLGWQHGDLTFGNLLFRGDDRIAGVLDFEAYEARGLPLLDLLFVLARRPVRRRRCDFGTLFAEWILPDRLPALERALVHAHVRELGGDGDLYRALAICCWLNHLRLRRDSWLVRSTSWRAVNLYAVAARLRRFV